MATPPRSAAGITLLELLVSVAIVATLAAVAVPQVIAVRDAARSTIAQGKLRESLLVAVTRSTMTRTESVICPSAGQACVATHDWTHGWIVFMDLDGDRIRDLEERLLMRVGPAGGGVSIISSAGRTRIVVQPNGSTSGSNATFTFCDARGAKKAVAQVLASDARLRSAPASGANAAACMKKR